MAAAMGPRHELLTTDEWYATLTAKLRALREVDLPALSEMGMHPYFLPQVSRLFKGAGYNHNQSEAAQLYAQRMGVKE